MQEIKYNQLPSFILSSNFIANSLIEYEADSILYIPENIMLSDLSIISNADVSRIIDAHSYFGFNTDTIVTIIYNFKCFWETTTEIIALPDKTTFFGKLLYTLLDITTGDSNTYNEFIPSIGVWDLPELYLYAQIYEPEKLSNRAFYSLQHYIVVNNSTRLFELTVGAYKYNSEDMNCAAVYGNFSMAKRIFEINKDSWLVKRNPNNDSHELHSSTKCIDIFKQLFYEGGTIAPLLYIKIINTNNNELFDYVTNNATVCNVNSKDMSRFMINAVKHNNVYIMTRLFAICRDLEIINKFCDEGEECYAKALNQGYAEAFMCLYNGGVKITQKELKHVRERKSTIPPSLVENLYKIQQLQQSE